MISDVEFRKLVSGRWLVPLLALVGAEEGARFAVMLARLGLSRSSLAASLTQLQDAGWLHRNPGHGHPLRPEYILTPAGERVAAFCMKVMAERARLGIEPGHLPRWSLPLLHQLDGGPARFSALRSALRPVTPRALSLTLKQMLSVDLIDRALEDEFPPVAIYGLSGRGAQLAAAMR